MRTTLFSKPPDCHFYLNISSCHPSHVLKNIIEWQFIGLQCICSEKLDYIFNSKIICNNFVDHGFLEKELRNSIKQVPEMDRNTLLQNRNEENKDL